MMPQFTATDFFVLKPILLLSLFGCGILILDFLIKDNRLRWWNAVTALLGELITGVAIWQHQRRSTVHLSSLLRLAVRMSEFKDSEGKGKL